MAWVMPIIAIAGSLLQAKGQQDQGAAAQDAANFTASQEEQAATAAQATAGRKATEERRQGQLAISRANALAAASGGGASDVGTTLIKSNIAGEAEYRALSALYEGERDAVDYRNSAKLRRAGGQSQARAANTQAMGTVVQSGSSLLSRYGN